MSEFKIKPATRSLADRIKAHMGVDDKGSLVDKDTFRKIATEDGRDVDRMIDDDNYRAEFIAASHLAGGEVAKDHMLANKDCNTVSGSFEIGRSVLEMSYERHRRVPNRVRDNETGNFTVDGEKDLWGDSTLAFKVYGARGSRGELKHVRDFLQDNFKSAFGS